MYVQLHICNYLLSLECGKSNAGSVSSASTKQKCAIKCVIKATTYILRY